MPDSKKGVRFYISSKIIDYPFFSYAKYAYDDSLSSIITHTLSIAFSLFFLALSYNLYLSTPCSPPIHQHKSLAKPTQTQHKQHTSFSFFQNTPQLAKSKLHRSKQAKPWCSNTVIAWTASSPHRRAG